MAQKNAIIEILKKHPCTASELPYRSISSISMTNRPTVRKIKVPGSRAAKSHKFLTVYYLAGDEDRAIEKFAETNMDTLKKMRWDGNNVLNSSIDRYISDRLKRRFQ